MEYLENNNEFYNSLKDAEKELINLKQENINLRLKLKRLEKEYFRLTGVEYKYE